MKKFAEVLDISPNHLFIIGTVSFGKRNEFFKQLLDTLNERNDIPEPLIGNRLALHSSLHQNNDEKRLNFNYS